MLAALAALGTVLNLRHALTASLPQLDAQVSVPGLHGPVTVTRDAQGVPSITAGSLDDLLFAQGYTTAADRLWQMDGLRRHAAGELAAILGPGLVEHDRRQRLLQIRAAADRAVAQLPPTQLAQLEAYARGVNAFIDSHQNALPVEFRLLAYKPAPWSPRDSLLVLLAMFQDLSTEFPQKLNREALSAHLPAALLPDLYPVGSWRDQPPGLPGRNLTAPHDVEQIPLDPSQSRLRSPSIPSTQAQELLAVSQSLGEAGRCEGCRAGSNNWAVSGLHTASGAPLLANDMHLNLGIPDIWYEAALHTEMPSGTPHLDAVGFTLPGVPFVIVGRNPHVAWGVTNLGADVQDLRIEHLRGAGNNTEYQRADNANGSWALVAHHPEHITVRGGRDVILDVLTTTHSVGAATMETPIVSPLFRSEPRALSLAWTAYDPTAISSPFLDVNTAADGASLVAALAGFGGPSLNLVWADDHGHIGYHAVGRVPVRGPAVQRPRALPEPPLPGVLPQAPGTPPADGEGEETSAEPVSFTSTTPGAAHLVRGAYHPPRRRRAPARAAVAPAPRRSAARPRAAKPLALETSPATPAALPSSQPLNYTVGSPIAAIPTDALDPAQEWSGYIAYGDLPSVLDPPQGFLATANSRITPDLYPWAVANDWVDPFRAERLVHLLTGRYGLTAPDMLRMQNDVGSDVNRAMAQRLAYALDHASSTSFGKDAKRLRQAADMLRTWDGEMTVSSAPAAVLTATRDALWPSLLVPQILAHDSANDGSQHADTAASERAAALAQLYTWHERSTALELLLQNQPARWLPHPFRSWNDFLAAMVEQGLGAEHAPSDLERWHYGRLHTVEIAHPLFGEQRLLARLLGLPGSTGAQPAPGDGTTVTQIGAHFGPSERFTADLATPDAAFGNITTGQSGNGHSPWYLDQFKPWLAGTTFALPSNHTAAVHTLRMVPQ